MEYMELVKKFEEKLILNQWENGKCNGEVFCFVIIIICFWGDLGVYF